MVYLPTWMVDISLRFATVQWLDKITNIFLLSNKSVFVTFTCVDGALNKNQETIQETFTKTPPFFEDLNTSTPNTSFRKKKQPYQMKPSHNWRTGKFWVTSHLMTWPFITMVTSKLSLQLASMRRRSPIHDNVLNAAWSIHQRVLFRFRPLTNGKNLATRKFISFINHPIYQSNMLIYHIPWGLLGFFGQRNRFIEIFSKIMKLIPTLKRNCLVSWHLSDLWREHDVKDARLKSHIFTLKVLQEPCIDSPRYGSSNLTAVETRTKGRKPSKYEYDGL